MIEEDRFAGSKGTYGRHRALPNAILEFPASGPGSGRESAGDEGPHRHEAGIFADSDGWSYRIRSVRIEGGSVVVTAAFENEGITREGIGVAGFESPESIIRAERAACADAAARFPSAASNRNKLASGSAEGTLPGPEARTLSDLISYSQLSRIRSLAVRLEIDADEECDKFSGCFVSELSRRSASRFILFLESMTGKQFGAIKKAG